MLWRILISLAWLFCVAGCGTSAATSEAKQNAQETILVTRATTPTAMPSQTPQPTGTLTPVPTATQTPTLFPTSSPTPTPRLVRSIDLAAEAANHAGIWFSTHLQDIPDTSVMAETAITVLDAPIPNRKDGQISETLISRYLFLQFGDIRFDLLEKYAETIRALFVRSVFFVDYAGNRALDWDRRSVNIPLDLSRLIGLANQLDIPIYLELNYSGYIPGPPGSGVQDLQPVDNISRTIEYLSRLQADGLHVEGVTFGDEIGDDSGFGKKKPTLRLMNLKIIIRR